MTIKKITKKKMTEKELKHYDDLLLDVESKSEDLVGSLSREIFDSPIDQFKWGICKEIVSLKVRKNFSNKKMAELMGVDKSKASLVLNYHIESFSIERLLGYLLALRNLEKQTDKKIDQILSVFNPLDAA